MTSNLGSENLLEGLKSQDLIRLDVEQSVLEAMRQHFKPEFLNRIDETIVFTALDKAALRQIVDLQLAQLSARL